jgi:hypothetical protein
MAPQWNVEGGQKVIYNLMYGSELWIWYYKIYLIGVSINKDHLTRYFRHSQEPHNHFSLSIQRSFHY